MCIFDQKHVCSQRQIPEWAMWRKRSPETATLLPPPSVLSAPRVQKQDSFDHLAAVLLEHTVTYSEAPLAACVYICDRSAHQSQPMSGALLPLPLHKHPCELVVSCEHSNPRCDTSACVTDVPNWSQCKSISLGHLGCRRKCVSEL